MLEMRPVQKVCGTAQPLHPDGFWALCRKRCVPARSASWQLQPHCARSPPGTQQRKYVTPIRSCGYKTCAAVSSSSFDGSLLVVTDYSKAAAKAVTRSLLAQDIRSSVNSVTVQACLH